MLNIIDISSQNRYNILRTLTLYDPKGSMPKSKKPNIKRRALLGAHGLQVPQKGSQSPVPLSHGGGRSILHEPQERSESSKEGSDERR